MSSCTFCELLNHGDSGAIQGKRRCHVPCGHISECTDELPLTVREGAILERRNIKMMNYLEIEKVIGREILDSRGNPTVEAEV